MQGVLGAKNVPEEKIRADLGSNAGSNLSFFTDFNKIARILE